MTIRLQDSRLQALVHQMTANANKLTDADVRELVDFAVSSGDTLSQGERASLQTLVEEHGNLFESPEARARLEAFQQVGDVGLFREAQRMAGDGQISVEDARALESHAMRNGKVSKREKVTLKALMGFYAPEMEPGAKEFVEELVGGASQGQGVDGAGGVLGAEMLADGQIALSEIQQAEQELAAKYGPDEAKSILIQALGQEPGKIEFEAIDYLQGKIGSMEGHVGRYQTVLTEKLAGAKLLDANFDGKLDENDLIFRKGADGEVDVQRIGQALRDRTLIGGAMIDAAHEMGKAKHRFGDLEANPVVWDIDEDDPNVMHLNPDFPPSMALRDIFNNPEFYQFECATAMVILRYKAMLDLIGDKDFDRICDDLRIGVWDQEDHAAKIWDVSGKANEGQDVDMTDATREKLTPGDYAYFKNWDVSEAAFKGGWQGENVIYLGNDQYYGHPFGLTTGKKIVNYLNKNRKVGSNRSASLLDLHARVHTDVLNYDRDPEK